MFPFRNILFPTDFSAHAHAALKYAAAFAQHGRGRVFLFNAQDGKVPVSLPEQMKNLLSDPLLNGVDVEPILVEGEPGVEIARAAIDFVVESDRAQLSEIVRRVRDGRLRTNIGTVATLDVAVAALNPTERLKGKTIIRVRG